MLSELFHYFRKYEQEIAREHDCTHITLRFCGDLSGDLVGCGSSQGALLIIFSFIDVKDAIKKFRKEIDSWQS